jgi:ubiquitin-protein ligase
MMTEPIWGVTIFPDFSDTINVKAVIDGPLGSSYEGGRFHLKINLNGYPHKPPYV